MERKLKVEQVQWFPSTAWFTMTVQCRTQMIQFDLSWKLNLQQTDWLQYFLDLFIHLLLSTKLANNAAFSVQRGFYLICYCVSRAAVRPASDPQIVPDLCNNVSGWSGPDWLRSLYRAVVRLILGRPPAPFEPGLIAKLIFIKCDSVIGGGGAASRSRRDKSLN